MWPYCATAEMCYFNLQPVSKGAYVCCLVDLVPGAARGKFVWNKYGEMWCQLHASVAEKLPKDRVEKT